MDLRLDIGPGKPLDEPHIYFQVPEGAEVLGPDPDMFGVFHPLRIRLPQVRGAEDAILRIRRSNFVAKKVGIGPPGAWRSGSEPRRLFDLTGKRDRDPFEYRIRDFTDFMNIWTSVEQIEDRSEARRLAISGMDAIVREVDYINETGCERALLAFQVHAYKGGAGGEVLAGIEGPLDSWPYFVKPMLEIVTSIQCVERHSRFKQAAHTPRIILKPTSFVGPTSVQVLLENAGKAPIELAIMPTRDIPITVFNIEAGGVANVQQGLGNTQQIGSTIMRDKKIFSGSFTATNQQFGDNSLQLNQCNFSEQLTVLKKALRDLPMTADQRDSLTAKGGPLAGLEAASTNGKPQEVESALRSLDAKLKLIAAPVERVGKVAKAAKEIASAVGLAAAAAMPYLARFFG